jgi:hypothetical protein
MRKYSALLLVPALAALLMVTGFVALGGDGGTTPRRQGSTSSNVSTSAPQATTPASPGSEPAVTVQPAAQAPEPADGGCNASAVSDAIAHSDAVGDDVTFEISYLNCGEGYGWARIVADHRDGATVLLKGSGADISLLNLGSSVCAIDSGMPASIADRLAPPGSHWRGECGL